MSVIVVLCVDVAINLIWFAMFIAKSVRRMFEPTMDWENSPLRDDNSETTFSTVSFFRTHEKDNKDNVDVYLLTETHGFHRFSSLQSLFHFEKHIYYELTVSICSDASVILAEGLLGTFCITRKMICCALSHRDVNQIYFANMAKIILRSIQIEQETAQDQAKQAAKEAKLERRQLRQSKIDKSAADNAAEKQVEAAARAAVTPVAKAAAVQPEAGNETKATADTIVHPAPPAKQTTAQVSGAQKVLDWLKTTCTPAAQMTQPVRTAQKNKSVTFQVEEKLPNAQEIAKRARAEREAGLHDVPIRSAASLSPQNQSNLRAITSGASTAKPMKCVYKIALASMAILLVRTCAYNSHGIQDTALESNALLLAQGQITMLENDLLEVKLNYTRLQESSGLTAAGLVEPLYVQTLLVATLNVLLRTANVELQDVKGQLDAAATGVEDTNQELHDTNIATMHESLDAVNEALREMTQNHDVLQAEVLDLRSTLNESTSALASAHYFNNQSSSMSTYMTERVEVLQTEVRDLSRKVRESNAAIVLLQAEVLELESESSARHGAESCDKGRRTRRASCDTGRRTCGCRRTPLLSHKVT